MKNRKEGRGTSNRLAYEQPDRFFYGERDWLSCDRVVFFFRTKLRGGRPLGKNQETKSGVGKGVYNGGRGFRFFSRNSNSSVIKWGGSSVPKVRATIEQSW